MGNSGNLHVIYMEISAEFPMKKFTGNTVAKYMGFSRVFHGMGSWDFTGNSRDFHGFCLLGMLRGVMLEQFLTPARGPDLAQKAALAR